MSEFKRPIEEATQVQLDGRRLSGGQLRQARVWCLLATLIAGLLPSLNPLIKIFCACVGELKTATAYAWEWPVVADVTCAPHFFVSGAYGNF